MSMLPLPADSVNSCPPNRIPWGADFRSLQLYKSLDTLHLGLHVQFESTDFHGILEGFKALCKRIEKPLSFENSQYPGFNGWLVHSHARKRYSFHLSSGDVHIFINTSQEPNNTPNVFVEIGSLPCWSPGYKESLDHILNCLKGSGAVDIICKVSRADLALDVVGINFDEIEATDVSKWIKQSRNFAVMGSGCRPNYFGLGLGGIIALRVYDKQEELKKNPAKQEFFNHIWGLSTEQEQLKNKEIDSCTPVVRVEFQMRRKAFRQFSIDVFEDLPDTLDSIWNYLTTQWCRLSEDYVDKSNHDYSDVDVSKFWLVVQNTEWNDIKVTVQRRPLPKRKDDHQLLNQIVGLSLSLGVIDRKPVSSVHELIENFIQRSSEYIQRLHDDHNQEYWRRISEKWSDCWGNEVFLANASA